VRRMDTFSIELLLTDACNLNCLHCYLRKGANFIDFNDAKYVIDTFSEYEGIREKTLILSGGEPLLHPCFSKILSYASRKNFHLFVLTNGLLIPKMMRCLPHNCVFQISVDGDKERHEFLRGRGTYEKAIEAIRSLKREGYSVIVKCVLHKGNVNSINHILSLYNKFRLDGVSFNFYYEPKNCKNLVEPLDYQEFEKIRHLLFLLSMFIPSVSIPYHYSYCKAGLEHLSISPSGDVWDCSVTQNKLGDISELERIIDNAMHRRKQRERKRPPCLPYWQRT